MAACFTVVSLGVARANGRYPATNGFVFSPSEPDQILLRVTFGLLVSRDRGASWDWVCEGALRISDGEDPMYVVTPAGTLVATTFHGVDVSRDRLCSFPAVGGPLEKRAFVDLTSRPSAPSTIVVFASTFAGDDANMVPTYDSELFETSDDAQTFTPLGSPFPNRTFLGETVDLAPSDGSRIYVTAVKNKGLENRTAHLFESRDHGKTWTEHAVPLEGTERSLFIAGVDPNDPERVYLRTSNDFEMPTRLLVSSDGGSTTRTVFTAKSALAGFALSPDGQRVFVGSSLDGLQMARTTDLVFAQRSKIEIQCLAFSPDGLLACSNERYGFVAGLSRDDGATFTPVLRLCNIRGPLSGCPVGSATQFECVAGGKIGKPRWPFQRQQFACDVPEGGRRPSDDAAIAGPGAPPEAEEGCSVDGGGARTAMPASAGFSLVVVALLWLRRGRRSKA
ncbi:MAG: hypothetical protein JST00_06605 [Deltaproteobacteria bacterium]|nr:hypothetical protein [Deltaproteobacteria bacterium]